MLTPSLFSAWSRIRGTAARPGASCLSVQMAASTAGEDKKSRIAGILTQPARFTHLDTPRLNSYSCVCGTPPARKKMHKRHLEIHAHSLPHRIARYRMHAGSGSSDHAQTPRARSEGRNPAGAGARRAKGARRRLRKLVGACTCAAPDAAGRSRSEFREKSGPPATPTKTLLDIAKHQLARGETRNRGAKPRTTPGEVSPSPPCIRRAPFIGASPSRLPADMMRRGFP